jgi:hypothetical protein
MLKDSLYIIASAYFPYELMGSQDAPAIGGACALDVAAFKTTTIETLTHEAIGLSVVEGSLPVRSLNQKVKSTITMRLSQNLTLEYRLPPWKCLCSFWIQKQIETQLIKT